MAIQASSSLYGTNLTAGSPNAKGSWAELFTTNENVSALVISAITSDQQGVQWLIDIGTGPASSESVLIANIPYSTGFQFDTGCYSIIVPVRIQNNTRIAARCQANSGGSIVKISVQAIGGFPKTVSNETYGALTASSAATTVDPGAVGSTFGSWVQLTASSGIAIKYMAIFITVLGNTALQDAAYALRIGTGGAGSEAIQIGDPSWSSDDFDSGFTMYAWVFPITIAAGTRISCQTACTITDATDRLVGVVAIGFTEVPTFENPGGGSAGKGKGKGGGGVNIQNVGGANALNIGNPGVSISVPT